MKYLLLVFIAFLILPSCKKNSSCDFCYRVLQISGRPTTDTSHDDGHYCMTYGNRKDAEKAWKEYWESRPPASAEVKDMFCR